MEAPIQASNQNPVAYNHHLVFVSKGVYHALLQLKSMQDVHLLWIDAIYINQESEPQERSQQVSIMGNIYFIRRTGHRMAQPPKRGPSRS